MIFTSRIFPCAVACFMGAAVVCAEGVPDRVIDGASDRAIVRGESAFTIVGVDGSHHVSNGARMVSLQVGESIITGAESAVAYLPAGRVAVAGPESEVHYLSADSIGVSKGAGAVSFRSGAPTTLVMGGVAVHSLDETQPSIIATDMSREPARLLAGEHLSGSHMRLATGNGRAVAVLTADGSDIAHMESGDSIILARLEDGTGYRVVSTEWDRFTEGAVLLPGTSIGGAAVVGGTGIGSGAATGGSALGLGALAGGGGFLLLGGDEDDSSGGTVEVPELAPRLSDSSPISVNNTNR